MLREVYAYADLGRAGLGNMLQPWARCEVFCHERNIPMLAPKWVKLKIGPIIRRERESRIYLRQFDNSGYIQGLKKARILLTGKKIDESCDHFFDAENYNAHGFNMRPLVHVFRGLADGFASLFPYRAFLRSRLVKILSPCNKSLLFSQSTGQAIGVHIRRGDHGQCLGFGDFLPDKGLYNLPEQWYINCINNIRKIVGPMPVKVFSDAKYSEIREVLSLPDTTFVQSNPAIVDLLLLSESRILITSWSSFSFWAALLSTNKSLWFPSRDFDVFRKHGLPVISTDNIGNIKGEISL